ncbi:2-C-methyl-D-erythritol 4-phosphate cytidylyltransferase [Frankia sp. CcI49]|uniref:2-C-methyl-D-erythritol 4-phosphate cytidylyltransferase n=1 Tax=unclassified Frankia TaxID=2632575 RepID=UPI0006CA2442|nr:MULTISPECIES: 2-C-methyl-D-erythritol 4-phosphate cytidylyltransferase [unclassified Frankia]KPM53103.1 2-C-methyl-D-erythritol 4-phosphate cytidylyltransferase [Frankia sp. R43]ONH58628.1 2-C-methyl-D-erythritol 4-phosphate cytidylyltransferase [Frankia sp. CcI49]
MNSRVGAVVPAAGRGERLGGGTPKALRPLAGRPMLLRAVETLLSSTLVSQVVVAAPPTLVDVVGQLLGSGVRVVPGGAERVDSVRVALDALDDDIGVVLVHDAARPLTPAKLVDAVATTVLDGHPAVIPVLPVTDTIKEIDADGRVVRTPRRDGLRAVQTPQGFRRDILRAAYANRDLPVTDDAGLVEALGVPVTTIPGAEEAFKVTRPADLVLAEALLAHSLPRDGHR